MLNVIFSVIYFVLLITIKIIIYLLIYRLGYSKGVCTYIREQDEPNIAKRVKLIVIQDVIDRYKSGTLNPFTALRTISDILYKKEDE